MGIASWGKQRDSSNSCRQTHNATNDEKTMIFMSQAASPIPRPYWDAWYVAHLDIMLSVRRRARSAS